jgi:prolyl 4-hydroxylase
MADDFEQHSVHALANPEKHLSNPVNAFLMVKRFTSDWEYMVDTYIRSNATEGNVMS